jgi:hypothetical protein
MRDSSATDYRLDAGVRVPAEARDFALHRTVPTGSEGHKATYLLGARGSFTGSKAVEARS